MGSTVPFKELFQLESFTKRNELLGVVPVGIILIKRNNSKKKGTIPRKKETIPRKRNASDINGMISS